MGTNGGENAYGAFDMNGNVTEWNDLTGAAGSDRQWRGGSWQDTEALYMSSSFSNTFPASDVTAYVGFRLASEVIAPVPEIDPAGMTSVLALVTGALGLLERRRLKAKVA